MSQEENSSTYASGEKKKKIVLVSHWLSAAMEVEFGIQVTGSYFFVS